MLNFLINKYISKLYYEIAKEYYNNKRYEEALEGIEKSIELSKDWYAPYLLKSKILYYI